MQDLARLSGHAQARISQLEAEGIRLTPDEIVRINALSWAVTSPGTRMGLSRGVPVFLCGIPLWPLTLQAQDWYERIGCRQKTERRRKLALAFAAAHCYRDTAVFDAIGPEQASGAVKDWARSLHCRMATLEEALSQIIQQDETEYVPPIPGSDKGGIDPGNMALMLSAMTGRPAAEYEQEMSASSVIRMTYYAMMMQDRADQKPTATGPECDALRALEYYISEIRESRKDGNGT